MHSPQSSEVDLGSRVMIRRGGSEPRGLLGEAQGQDCRPAPMARSLVLQPEKENKGRLRRNCQWHKFASKHSYTPSSLLRSIPEAAASVAAWATWIVMLRLLRC